MHVRGMPRTGISTRVTFLHGARRVFIFFVWCARIGDLCTSDGGSCRQLDLLFTMQCGFSACHAREVIWPCQPTSWGISWAAPNSQLRTSTAASFDSPSAYLARVRAVVLISKKHESKLRPHVGNNFPPMSVFFLDMDALETRSVRHKTLTIALSGRSRVPVLGVVHRSTTYVMMWSRSAEMTCRPRRF